MAEDTSKATPNSGTTGSNTSSTTKSSSKPVLAGSPSGASVYTPEQIEAFKRQQVEADKRDAALSAAAFEIPDEELPHNKVATVGFVGSTDNFNEAQKGIVEETSAANPKPTPSIVLLDPTKLGIVTKTPGMDETIPGGRYVRVRGNEAYYVNANDEEIDENGKLIYPRQEVNILNMAQPSR